MSHFSPLEPQSESSGLGVQQCGTDCSRESRETHAADVMNGRRREVQKLPAGSLDPVKASLEAKDALNACALHRLRALNSCAAPDLEHRALCIWSGLCASSDAMTKTQRNAQHTWTVGMWTRCSTAACGRRGWGNRPARPGEGQAASQAPSAPSRAAEAPARRVKSNADAC